MNIHFSAKELKNDQISITGITFPYLVAIKNKHPNVFAGLKALIEKVEGAD